MKSAMKTHAARSRGGIVWNDTLEVRVAERARRSSRECRKATTRLLPPSCTAPDDRDPPPPPSQETRVFDALSEKDAMALLTSPLKADGAPDSPTTVARGENERAAGSAAKSAAVTPVLPAGPCSRRAPRTPPR